MKMKVSHMHLHNHMQWTVALCIATLFIILVSCEYIALHCFRCAVTMRKRSATQFESVNQGIVIIGHHQCINGNRAHTYMPNTYTNIHETQSFVSLHIDKRGRKIPVSFTLCTLPHSDRNECKQFVDTYRKWALRLRDICLYCFQMHRARLTMSARTEQI